MFQGFFGCPIKPPPPPRPTYSCTLSFSLSVSDTHTQIKVKIWVSVKHAVASKYVCEISLLYTKPEVDTDIFIFTILRQKCFPKSFVNFGGCLIENDIDRGCHVISVTDPYGRI
jgi:hypothetical protein